jgi:NAD kinase
MIDTIRPDTVEGMALSPGTAKRRPNPLMRYFVSAADDAIAQQYTERLRTAGVDVVDEFDSDAVIVSIGGDGAILYNARRYERPTILPVAVPGSEGNTIQVTTAEAVDRIETLESGSDGEHYRLETHHKLAAYRDGNLVRPGFRAMNDIHLHHTSPVRAAKFAVRILDRGVVYETDRAIGDGLLVATPFGSTAYYRALTGGTFDSGVGVAFNNRHKPADAPDHLVLSPDATVEVRLRERSYGPNAALYRDDDPEPYRLSGREPVTIARSDRTVEIVRLIE